MERKEDLTLTNKQMLVAQLRKEQEQNRILRKELEEAKKQRLFAEMDAISVIAMCNDEMRKVEARNLHKIKFAQRDILMQFLKYLLIRKSVYMENEELKDIFFEFMYKMNLVEDIKK